MALAYLLCRFLHSTFAATAPCSAIAVLGVAATRLPVIAHLEHSPIILGGIFVYGPPSFVITVLIIYWIYERLSAPPQPRESEADRLLRQAKYELHQQKALAKDPYAKWEQQQRRGSLIPPPPGAERRYQIASNGKNIGEHTVSDLKRMIALGTISMRNHYFDDDANEWMPLDCLPDLV